MSMNMYEGLNDMHLDVLREIGNIGSGNAATALSEMLFRPVQIQVPKIGIMDFAQVTQALGGPEQMIVGLLLSLGGDVEGMLMFLLQKDFAHMTINTLLGQSLTDFSEVDDMALSAMQEVANIMAASYVGAIADMTGMSIQISVPDICIDMAGAILSVPAIHYANISDKIIFIEDEFSSEQEKVVSHILMIPDMASLKKIMANLGIEL